MKIALLTSDSTWAGFFIQRWHSRLTAEGVHIGCVVVDENRTRRTNPLSHALSVAKRQAKVARSSLPTALLRLMVFRLCSGLGRRHTAVVVADIPADIPTFRVASLNSAETVEAVRRCGCELSCLLGGRILTRRTIQDLGHIILNGHASDPRFVRGRPPVFWEVLNGDGHIWLTVHQVVEKLDAGPIYGQRSQEIIFCGGIGATMRATMEAARVRMTDLFAEVALGVHADILTPKAFNPGPVRTIPSILQLFRAGILCRRRSGLVPVLAHDA